MWEREGAPGPNHAGAPVRRSKVRRRLAVGASSGEKERERKGEGGRGRGGGAEGGRQRGQGGRPPPLVPWPRAARHRHARVGVGGEERPMGREEGRIKEKLKLCIYLFHRIQTRS